MWLVCLLFSFSLTVSAGETIDGLLQKAQADFKNGQYTMALENLSSAQSMNAGPEQQAMVQGLLGLTHYQMRHFEQADNWLNQAMTTDPQAEDKPRWLAALADVQLRRGKTEQAEHYYRQALQAADKNATLALGIELGRLSLVPSEQRLSLLQRLSETLQSLGNIEERARYALNIAMQAQNLGESGLKLAYQHFELARSSAQQPRSLAEALGGLAQLYEDQKRVEDALKLDQSAIKALENTQAEDLLLHLEWRQARLYRALNQIPNAIAAYQRAVEHIEAIRQDIPVEYHHGRSSFRETLEPVYLGLADLLLRQAAQQHEPIKSVTLRRARDVVELIKQSEVEDFLGGRCGVQSIKTSLQDSVEPGTAIIYPIMLPDRLELLLGVDKELYQSTQPVTSNTLQGLAKSMAQGLRSGNNFKYPGQALYHWLLAPVESLLAQHQVQTLVIVPDGALRLIPMSALYDGQRFLIEKYALATSPGLTLFEPTPLHLQQQRMLLAGVSQPGGVLEHLPAIFLRTLSDNVERGIALDRSITGIRAIPGVDVDTLETREIDLSRLRSDPIFRQKIQEQLSLPGVDQEMASLQKELPNTLLMNENFTVDSFKQQLAKDTYNVIHIASHGVFGKTAATSFIMAYDNVINVNDLESLLKLDKFKKQPVEMLTLSACQTAEGNDRTPLGLAGIALKAKVRSALGTLWPVSDEAAAKLMTSFYKQLTQPNTTKAQALRQAQLQLLKDQQLEQPFFWAPFILVGNWL